MVPWLRFNLIEKPPLSPSEVEDKHNRKPNWAKAPVVEAGREENPARGSDKKPSILEMVTAKQTQQKAHTAQSQIPENLQLRQEVLAPTAGRTYG